jgi:DNA-binding transcriptional ArsR family regulator
LDGDQQADLIATPVPRIRTIQVAAGELLDVLDRSLYHRCVAMNCCDPDTGAAVALFRSLGDPARLAIVSRLAEGEARVVDLTRLLGLAQSTVSKHLACLRDCRLVQFRAEGRQSYYYLARPELIDLLRSAELLLAETGNAVALCPGYGVSAMGAS